jgi:DNA-3-methyladenine glycosylase II
VHAEAIDHLTAVDPIFNSIIEKYGVPVIPERPQGLETLVLLILEQQVSIDSAKATFKIKGKDKNLRPPYF